MFHLSTFVRQIPEPPQPHDNQEEKQVTQGVLPDLVDDGSADANAVRFGDESVKSCRVVERQAAREFAVTPPDRSSDQVRASGPRCAD